MKALQVQNGNPTSSDLNEAGFLERAFNQIYSGTLDAKHLREEFLRQPNIVAPKPPSALKQPSCGAIFHLMERLTGRRLLRLRQQGQVEQSEGSAKTLIRSSNAMNLRNWNTDYFAADLNDCVSE